MNIDSKRFSLRGIGGGLVQVRDRRAPYHCHTVALCDLPDLSRLASMSETAFDRAVSRAVYS